MSSDLSSRCAAVEALEARRLLATVPSGFSDAGFATGFSAATSMAFAPDGRLFVTQQGGQVRVVKNGQHLGAPFLSVSTDSAGERGLLGLAFDPQFSTNRFVYVYYTVSTTPKHNRVSRFTAALNSNGTIGDTAVPGSEQVILSLDVLPTATNHNGGAIHFGPDGKLYVAVGDATNGANAQSLSTRHGKVLRINKDGTIPTDNPFFNSTTGANRAIWAMGLRNPYTFSFKPGSSRMFINDVGSSKFEEINDGLPARNYGWPQTEGFFNQASFPAFTNPIHAYARGSGAGQGFAITGGTFYNPPTQQFPSSFVGDYFFADFGTGWIRTLDPAAGNATAHFAGNISAPVDLDVGPDGALYYLERGAGRVGRISHNASSATVVDFEPAAVGQISSGIYVEDGFRFSNLPGRGGSTLEPLNIFSSAQGYSSKVLHPVNYGRRIDVVRENGASFDLTSFDYAAGRWGEAGDLIVTGTFTNGSTQTKTASFSSRSLTKLPLAWTGLTKVSVNWAGGANEAYGAVDNFVFGTTNLPYRFDGDRVVLEAEHHDANLPRSGFAWSPFNDGTLVGGGVQATPPEGFTSGATGPELQYRVNFPSAGTYRLWLRGKGVIGRHNNTDSAWVGLDGQTTNQSITAFATGSTPSWSNFDTTDGVASLNVGSAGVHTVNIWMREAGFMLDRVLLTSDASFVPSGTGPPESSRG